MGEVLCIMKAASVAAAVAPVAVLFVTCVAVDVEEIVGCGVVP